MKLKSVSLILLLWFVFFAPLCIQGMEETLCGICQTALHDGEQDVVSLACASQSYHSFHANCLTSWDAVREGRGTYPLCTFPLRARNSSRRLYSLVHSNAMPIEQEIIAAKELEANEEVVDRPRGVRCLGGDCRDISIVAAVTVVPPVTYYVLGYFYNEIIPRLFDAMLKKFLDGGV